MRRGTLAFSWGAYGGFYVHRRRVCLGWVALTLIPRVEVDDLMRAFCDAAVLEDDALLALRMAFADADPHGHDWSDRAEALWAEVRD